MLNHPFKMLLMIIIFLTVSVQAYAITLRVELNAINIGSPMSGIAIIDFIDGDGINGSSAMLYNISTNASVLSGSVAAVNSNEFLFNDTELMSSLCFNLADIYSGFYFTVDANLIDPGTSGFPDSFVLSLTDSNYTPLFSTADPRGTDALFVLSALGEEVYPPSGFSLSVSEVSESVPEPSTLLLIAVGFLCLLIFRKKMGNLVIPVLFLSIFCYNSAEAALSDVTNQVSIVRAPLVYSRITQTYNGLITISNIGSTNLNSPMYLVVSGMPDTVSVNNATNLSPEGKPMLSLPVYVGGLTPGQTIKNFNIRFHNPNGLKFTPVFAVMADSGNLPPDPGAAGKASLSGVDSNNNGIRDDVEIYIDVNFGSSMKLKEGLNQFALSMQKGIIANTVQESMLAGNSLSRAMECLNYIAPDSTAWKSIQGQAINTPERFAAWRSHEARLSGKVFPSRRTREWKSSCTFDPDSLN